MKKKKFLIFKCYYFKIHAIFMIGFDLKNRHLVLYNTHFNFYFYILCLLNTDNITRNIFDRFL